MQINGKNFTIGADPEVFMGMDGQFVSAHDAVPGDKADPFKVDHGAVQVDGMALEFNIDPANDLEEFHANLNSVQNTLKDMIGDHTFLEQASVFFTEDYKKTVPEANLILGCDVDYNGWTMADNPKPNADMNMRTAGGHVHIGGFETDDPFSQEHFESCARLARILDEELGTYSILWDKDDQRRSMYGQAGAFRPKSYGMEYRTLSNAWIFKPELVDFVYGSVKDALVKMFERYEPNQQIKEIINTSNRESDFFKNNLKAEQFMA